MSLHSGKTVEYCVRKLGINISDLARCMSVDRKTVYNWFKQESLSKEIIQRIGTVISHDFSAEFPELFDSGETNLQSKDDTKEVSNVINLNALESDHWQVKYITLLEKQKEFLEELSKLHSKKASNQ
jgi:plasmid maintenance system antidote protein VapI